ncbi:MAG: hypothetical protein OHK0012_26170 [Synechococcales cyanobacterium]
MALIILIAISIALFSRERTIEAIQATLFSLGVVLLALMLLVVVAYSSDNSQAFVELIALAIACTHLVCLATFIAFVRNANISTAKQPFAAWWTSSAPPHQRIFVTVCLVSVPR